MALTFLVSSSPLAVSTFPGTSSVGRLDRTVIITHYPAAFVPSRALGVTGGVAASDVLEVACTSTSTPARAFALLPGEVIGYGVVEIIIVAASEVVVLPAYGSLV